MVLHAILDRLVAAVEVAGAFLDGYPEPQRHSEEVALTDCFVQDLPLEMELKISCAEIENVPWPVVPFVCAGKGT